MMSARTGAGWGGEICNGRVEVYPLLAQRLAEAQATDIAAAITSLNVMKVRNRLRPRVLLLSLGLEC